jgi:predicted transcriptional regulator
MLVGNEVLASEFVKEHARKVADVMTREVITATPETPLATIANLLEQNAIKRVPIVRDGRLVGIVSRANLLQALASQPPVAAATPTPDDASIREKVLSKLDAEPWARPAFINVIVQNGVVELWGMVESETERAAVRVAAEATPGVRSVNDNLVVRQISTGY